MLTRQPQRAHPPLSPSPAPPWHEAPGLAEHSVKFLGESPGKAETAPRRAQSLQLAGFREGMEAGRAGVGRVRPPTRYGSSVSRRLEPLSPPCWPSP